MTIREFIEQKKRRFASITFVGIGLCLIAVFLGPAAPILWFLFLLGFVLALLTQVYALVFGYRCPRCATRWTTLAQTGRTQLSIDKRIHYCPYCGCDVDAELDGEWP